MKMPVAQVQVDTKLPRLEHDGAQPTDLVVSLQRLFSAEAHSLLVDPQRHHRFKEIDMSITVSHTTSTARRTPRRLAALAMSAALAAGTAGFVGGNTAGAASPGVFNYAQCIPSYRSVIQDVELYRSTATEYVQIQGALVNTTTGSTILSQWALGTGATAKAAFRYSNVPKGTYNVWYHWAVWSPSKRAYVYSGWVQVTGAGLSTYGYETQPNVFVGGSTGRCAI